MSVVLAMPKEFRRGGVDSDEALGAVSFGRDREIFGIEKDIGVALVGTHDVLIPPSLDAAIDDTRGGVCRREKCAIVKSEVLDGGYLVVVRDSKSLTVVTYKRGSGGRAFRCDAYADCPLVKDLPRTWLDDPNDVKDTLSALEAICRSAHAI